MPAYFVFDIEVHDRAGMREYLERVPGTLKAARTNIVLVAGV